MVKRKSILIGSRVIDKPAALVGRRFSFSDFVYCRQLANSGGQSLIWLAVRLGALVLRDIRLQCHALFV